MPVNKGTILLFMIMIFAFTAVAAVIAMNPLYEDKLHENKCKKMENFDEMLTDEQMSRHFYELGVEGCLEILGEVPGVFETTEGINLAAYDKMAQEAQNYEVFKIAIMRSGQPIGP